MSAPCRWPHHTQPCTVCQPAVSAPVDVLAVIAVMQNKAQIYDSLPGGTEAQAAEFQRQYFATRDAFAAMIEAARKLEARGFFAPVSCADAATLADMAAMRAALARIGDSK